MTTQLSAPRTHWTAVVLTDTESHFAGRNTAARRSTEYVPPGLLADPGWLLDQVADMFADEGTLIVPRVPGPYHQDSWRQLAYVEQLRECARLAAGHGWSAAGAAIDQAYPWVSFTHPERAMVHLGMADRIPVTGDQLVDPADPPAVQADLLARYHAAVGVAWRSTAGVAGIQMIRALFDQPVQTRQGPRRRQQPVWIEGTDKAMTGAGDIIWRRRLTAAERDLPCVAQFDLRMAYGAAAGVADLPTGRLVPTGACEFDPDLSGYWRVFVPPQSWWASNSQAGPPIINPGRIGRDRTVWITTPLLVLLSERRVKPEVIDSMTCAYSQRLLRGWYERLRDARVMAPAADAPRLAAAIKSTANAAIGMMRSGRGRVQRRIWADTIIDLSRANLWRKLSAAQPVAGWPFRVEHDSAWFAYTVGQLDEFADALKVGPAMGRFRLEQHQTMGEYQQQQPKGTRQ